jgi:hypothetical protein
LHDVPGVPCPHYRPKPGPPKGKVVDHVDGNQTNNCQTNLRPATRTQNRGNQRKHHDSASRFKGTFYNRDARKWYAKCTYAGQNHCSVYFDTDIEAARAYDALAVAWFGEFARLNFPREWLPERRAQVYAENEPQRQEAEKHRAKNRRKKANADRERRERGKPKRPNRKTAKPPRARGTPRDGKNREQKNAVKPRRSRRPRRQEGRKKERRTEPQRTGGHARRAR